MKKMVKIGDHYKQGQCRECGIPLFGHKRKRRTLCGHCKKKAENEKGR